jgi:hypothetical protein
MQRVPLPLNPNPSLLAQKKINSEVNHEGLVPKLQICVMPLDRYLPHPHLVNHVVAAHPLLRLADNRPLHLDLIRDGPVLHYSCAMIHR